MTEVVKGPKFVGEYEDLKMIALSNCQSIMRVLGNMENLLEEEVEFENLLIPIEDLLMLSARLKAMDKIIYDYGRELMYSRKYGKRQPILDEPFPKNRNE